MGNVKTLTKVLALTLILTILTTLSALSQVRNFFIYINPDSLNLLYSRSIWDETYVPMILKTERSQHAGGIRFKGHTTRYYPKKPFRIKLNKGQELDGYGVLGFNALYTDKSLIREAIVWHIWNKEMKMIGPETYFANLYINDKNYGLYLFVERIDQTFKRNPQKFGFSPGGSMYQPDDVYHSGDLKIPADSMDYFKFYQKEFPGDSNYADLIQLIKEINEAPVENFHEFVDRRFFSESVLNWLVLNALVHSGDTYNKNYYLYHDSVTDKWLVIPWDYDLTFGRDGTSALPYPLNLLNDKFKYWYPPGSGPENPLKEKFLQNSVLLQRYKQRLDSMLANVFTEQRMISLVDSLYNLVREYVYRDNFKWGTNDEFEEQVEALKYYMTARRFYLYKWLSNYWPGEISKATLKIERTDFEYHFVDKIGRLLATFWFHEFSNLDSITVIVFPDSTPPALPSDVLPDKFVRRVFKIIPYPSTARFRARVRLEYRDEDFTRTELSAGVNDERFLKLHYFDGTDWKELDSKINTYANTLTVDNLTESIINSNNIFAVFIPQTYKKTWGVVPSLTWNKLYKVRFSNSNTGYIVGETTSIFMTTDGGRTWTYRSLEKQIPFRDIAFADSLVFIVGDQGLVYKGRIGDTLWTQISLGVMDNFVQVGFSGRYGFIRGENNFFYTNDGGNNWVKLNFWIGGETAIGSRREFLTISRNQLVKWSAESADIYTVPIARDTTVELKKIARVNDTTYVLTSNDSVYIFKIRQNNDWVKSSPLPRKLLVNDIKAIDTARIFLACNSGIILFSKDGGTTWHIQPTGTTLDVYSIDFTDSLHGFASGISGLILNTEKGGIVKVKQGERAPIFPLSVELYQNYPNPFNASTVISFSLPASSYAVLDVFDILGRKVATVAEGFFDAGQHSLIFNAENLASGIYFYRLTASNQIIVKKMLLIK